MGEWMPLGRARVTYLCKWRTAELLRKWGKTMGSLPPALLHSCRSERGGPSPPPPPSSTALPQCPLLAETTCVRQTSSAAVFSFGTGRRRRLLLLLRLLLVLLHQGPNIIFMQIAVAVATTPKRRSLPRRLPVDGR